MSFNGVFPPSDTNTPLADNTDGAFIPASAYTHHRYLEVCRRLWRTHGADFQTYERFVITKIDKGFDAEAAAAAKLDSVA